MTAQPYRPDLPRDGVGWVFVAAVPIENEAVIPPRTTLYIREPQAHAQSARTTEGQPGDGNHHGDEPSAGPMAQWHHGLCA